MRWLGCITWLLLCACSREERAAVDAGEDARLAPSAPPPQTPSPPSTPSLASALPPPIGDPVDAQNPWERCRTGYAPLGDPKRDVLQLGLMCGPSTGMRVFDERVEGVAPGEQTKQLEGKTGECFRVVFAAERGVDAKLSWSSAAAHIGEGSAARLMSRRGQALIAPGASALCLSAPGVLALRLETRGGGRYAYQILKRR
ncbi:MAG: hypothetical protein H6718_36435 [Polyangiaceae bacterium]|nr:hypothetical protein [Myxococcales bacterium]MCB9590950.1 hypothetical protein [Polyangiaceae bacterium]MCB9605146.1 hypothetical protein [Polyangiaceae bacterium]